MTMQAPTLAAAQVAEQKSPWVVLLSTGLAVFAVFLDTTILFVAFTAIGQDYAGVSTASLSWILNAYTIAFAAMLIPAGRLADRIGRRKTFLSAVVLFTLASMLCGAASSVNLLILARVLQALGAAALVPSSLALVLQTFPRAKIPMAVAIWGAVGAVAGAVGPTLGALVVQHAGWRWAFYINLPVGLFSLFLGQKVLPEGRESKPGRFPDPLSIGLLVSGLGSMAYAIVQTDEWGWSSPQFLGTFAASVVLVVGFVLRCAAVDNPLFDLRLFKAPSFRWANLAMLVYSIGFSAMFLGNILFFTRVWHYSILQSGMAVSVGPLIVATTAPLFGRLAGRIGQRKLLIPGGLVWASSGLFLLLRASSTPDYLGSYLPAIFLSGFGVALCLPQLSSVSVQSLPADSFGSGSAVNQAVRNLGSTLGVALVIAFTSQAAHDNAIEGFRQIWFLLAASGGIVSALSLLLPRPVAASAARSL
jgi:EmrB/QacA subfamily drug resistance transporter